MNVSGSANHAEVEKYSVCNYYLPIVHLSKCKPCRMYFEGHKSSQNRSRKKYLSFALTLKAADIDSLWRFSCRIASTRSSSAVTCWDWIFSSLQIMKEREEIETEVERNHNGLSKGNLLLHYIAFVQALNLMAWQHYGTCSHVSVSFKTPTSPGHGHNQICGDIWGVDELLNSHRVFHNCSCMEARTEAEILKHFQVFDLARWIKHSCSNLRMTRNMDWRA